MPSKSLQVSGAMIEALELRPAMRIWVGGNNKEARREIEKVVAGLSRPPFGPLDAVFITAESNAEAVYFATKLRRRVTANAYVWITVTNCHRAG